MCSHSCKWKWCTHCEKATDLLWRYIKAYFLTQRDKEFFTCFLFIFKFFTLGQLGLMNWRVYWGLLQGGKYILDKNNSVQNLKNNKKCEVYKEKFIFFKFFCFHGAVVASALDFQWWELTLSPLSTRGFFWSTRR